MNTSTAPDPPRAPQPPRRTRKVRESRYAVRGTLGEGGMGDVVLCADQVIGRDVAMKVMRSTDEVEEEAEARFLREARVQGRLEHPSIVPLYDMGRDADGNVYFTMKCVRGQTLAKILIRLAARDPGALVSWSRRKLLRAFGQACLAVDFAHARGVLHRDLKPSNIMIGDFGEVYVLDWGVAKLMERPRGEDSTRTPSSDDGALTPMGEVIGTLGYMPPEQATGGLDSLDARADVYALGAILFELLALEPLHVGVGKAKLLASTMHGADARLSARAPERDVPLELEAICSKATASKREDRYRSARELNDALERYLDPDRDVRRRASSVRRVLSARKPARARRAPGPYLFLAFALALTSALLGPLVMVPVSWRTLDLTSKALLAVLLAVNLAILATCARLARRAAPR
jgi:eukaryotic-like serine/threonine-protein kinase